MSLGGAMRRVSRGGRPNHTPIRVLIIVQNLPVPLDRRVWQEAQALTAAGHRVSVICPRGDDDDARFRVLDDVGIYTYPPPRPATGVLGFIREFLYCWLWTARLSVTVARSRGFDVLQACNPPDTYWLLALLYKAAGKRFVYDQHDLCPEVYEARFGERGFLHRLLLLLERATYATADAVISTNESYRDIALRRGKRSSDEVTIVRSSPDPETMRRGAAEPELRHGRAHLVCYLGIMGPQDGVDRLLGAIHALVYRFGRTDCHFGIMGFGDCYDELREQATRLDLDDYVTFTGRVGLPEIHRWLSTADVGVTPDPPTRFNDLSTMNKTLEYMAYELPVVGFDLTENRHVASIALSVAADDDDALAKAIIELLDDPARRRLMGQAGRARIAGELSWQAQVPGYVGVFERLAGR